MKKTISLFILGLLIVVGGQFASAIAPEGDVTGFITEGAAEQAINTSVDTAYLLSVGGLFLVNDNFAVWNDAIIDIAAGLYPDADKGLFVGSLGEPDNTQKTVCADDAGKLVLCATPAALSCGSLKVDWEGTPYNWADGTVYYHDGASAPVMVAFCGANHDLTAGQNINTNASSTDDACITPSGLFADLYTSNSPTQTLMFYEASTTTGQWNMVTIQQNGVITAVSSYYADLYSVTGGTCSGSYMPCGQATDEASCQNICSDGTGSGAYYGTCGTQPGLTIPACTWAQCS